MFDRLAAVRDSLRDVVAELDPEVLRAEDAKDLVAMFAEMERLVTAGKTLAARRVAASGAWQSDGDRSPAHWLARTTKSSVGSAVGVLQTAEAVAKLPATDAALRAGELSEIQAREVVAAAAVSPASEKELLKVAQTDSVNGLRHKCASVKAAALPDEVARYEAIRARRRVRHWSDPDGAFRLDAVLTPDAGATLLAVLEPHRDLIYKEARKQGRRESTEACAADALIAIAKHVRDCDQEPVASGPKAMVHVVVSHTAFQRGEIADGEICEIPGVGPVPVAVAEDLAQDAILAALIKDGTDVRSVCNIGRTIPARLRAAVIARRDTCAVPGCDVRRGLEIDHTKPIVKEGRSQLINLDRLCSWHHYLKTYKGYVLAGPPDARTFSPPARPPPHG